MREEHTSHIWDDGATHPFYIQESRDGNGKVLYPALRGTRRFPSHGQRSRGYRYMREESHQSYMDCSVVIAKLILDWDAMDREGQVLPISGASIMAMHPRLWDELFGMLLAANKESDPDPELDPDQTTSEARELLATHGMDFTAAEAALEGE